MTKSQTRKLARGIGTQLLVLALLAFAYAASPLIGSASASARALSVNPQIIVGTWTGTVTPNPGSGNPFVVTLKIPSVTPSGKFGGHILTGGKTGQILNGLIGGTAIGLSNTTDVKFTSSLAKCQYDADETTRSTMGDGIWSCHHVVAGKFTFNKLA